MPKFRFIYRSAITGRFVSKRYVKTHPKTTVKEKVKIIWRLDLCR